VNNRNELVEKHFAELSMMYPDLNLENTNEISVIRGLIDFIVPYKDEKIQDSFLLEIFISPEYNRLPPKVKEIGGRIPRNFHTSYDGFLCLEVPIEVRKKFAEDPSLVGFVKSLLVPYLFSFSYWTKYGVMPFGEHSHGYKGILEYYKNIFNVNSTNHVLKLLKLLITKDYRVQNDCPCGSGKKFLKCHQEIILKLDKYQSQIDFIKDFLHCEDYMRRFEWQYSERYRLRS
jgi:hypothetical protein